MVIRGWEKVKVNLEDDAVVVWSTGLGEGCCHQLGASQEGKVCWLCWVLRCPVSDGSKFQPRIEVRCQGGVKAWRNRKSRVDGIAQRGRAEI